MTMTNKKPVGSSGRDSAEWNSAWTTVSRLAVARQVALRELDSQSSAAQAGGENRSGEPPDGSSRSIDHGHLEDAIAEIEQASAALKSAHPTLEPWQPMSTTPASGEFRRPRSVWLLI